MAETLIPPPPASISDDAIQLRLLRVLEAGDTDSRTADTQFLAEVPEIRYAIHRREEYKIAPLWILIEPANVASRRTVERAGFRLVDEIDTTIEAVKLGLGPRVCRCVINPR
jgi:hypothetical protein